MIVAPMMDTNVSAQLTASIISVGAIQWLKNSPSFPFINPNSKTAPWILSAAAALVSAAGIHFAFDHVAGTLLITGLNMESVTHGIFEAIESFCMNHFMYKSMNPSTK